MIFRLQTLVSFLLVAFLAVVEAKPTLFIIGDSTVRNSTEGQMGWGDPLEQHFDPAAIQVINRAIGGRSSRTFLTEGRWDAVMAHLKPGDFVLMQFGHNDGGKPNDDRCRASLRGTGEETEEIVRTKDQQKETVHTYGWYLRKYIRDAKSKGAVPIVASLIPRNTWAEGKISRSADGYAAWARETATDEQVPFVDFNKVLSDDYEALGQEGTGRLFAGTDHTHTSPAGAAHNAAVMAREIRKLSDCRLSQFLLSDQLWMPAIFSDHMVIQRDLPIKVWGTSKPGASVGITFNKHSTRVVADDTGRWAANLPPQSQGGPFTLEVDAGAKKVFNDVMIGEVWLCSGQSNMDFTLASTAKRSYAGVTDSAKEVAAADHPRLRMFTAEWMLREFPQRDVPGKWAVCSPSTAGDFSAVAYYFGRALMDRLDVPVGLVNCSYGASTIEAWLSNEALAPHPQFKELLEAFGKKRLAYRDDPAAFQKHGEALASQTTGKPPRNPDPVQDQHNPSVLYNGMIAPLVPYPLRGAIWYQGESNLNTRAIYQDLQAALIAEWRKRWNQPEMPFYFVQLAAYKSPSPEPSGGQLPEMREAQAKALEIPHTGMAVTIDIGDEKDVHPRNKLDVGKRLAALALAGSYGSGEVAGGPSFRAASVESSRIRISFDQTGGGLIARDGALRQFAIAGADRKFVWAEAVIEAGDVLVSHPQVAHPLYVRYAWDSNPHGANLYNSEGFPAAPFRTDP